MKDELRSATKAMAKGKAPEHDDILVEFFENIWPTVGKDFHLMVAKNMEARKFYEGITKELISLIPKEGD